MLARMEVAAARFLVRVYWTLGSSLGFLGFSMDSDPRYGGERIASANGKRDCWIDADIAHLAGSDSSGGDLSRDGVALL
jgi:hypothetical protein